MSRSISAKAAACLVGGWGFINSTLYNTTTNAIITADWGYPVPSGGVVFTANGYTSLVVTANDITKPALRPTFLTQNDYSSGTDAEWALIGKYSIAGLGPYRISNVTASKARGVGPQGTISGAFTSATLPDRIGPFDFTFKFYDDCEVWNLVHDLGADLSRVAWYEKLADQAVHRD